jgi:Arc/MetJ family transcription regulator
MDGHITPRHDGAAARGRPARRQVTVDAELLETAMRLTGHGQSDTVNEALAHLAELAASSPEQEEWPEQSAAGC